MNNREQELIYIDPLLRKIRHSSWTERLAAKFEATYGGKLHWQIVVYMEKMGLLQYRFNPKFLTALSSRRLELYENTVSDLWIKLLGGLVNQFVEGVETGRVHQEFSHYLGGVIRHLVVANARSLGLLSRETPAEIIRGICEAKQEATLQAKIAWAKFCYEQQVREAILIRCPRELFPDVYRNIHHIVDYFFEKFILTQCEQFSQYPASILNILIDTFLGFDSNLTDTQDFIGTITPFATGGEVVGQVPETVSDDEYLSSLQQSAQRGWV